MKKLILFGLLAVSQLFSQEPVRVTALRIADGSFIPGMYQITGIKPGFRVYLDRADGKPLEADAYRITIRYTRDGMTFEQSKYAKPDRPGVVFEVVGVLVSATATPILPFEERVQ